MAETNGAWITQGTTIRGRIQGDGELVVEGSIEGSIQLSQRLRIESVGRVHAEVSAPIIEVIGQLGGNIQAQEQIVLTAESNTEATLRAPKIEVHEGARLVANFEMDVTLPPGVGV